MKRDVKDNEDWKERYLCRRSPSSNAKTPRGASNTA